MTKRNHDLLRNVLDELCVTPIYTAACARCGISTKSLWRYVRASQRQDDPDGYRLVWCDVEDWFHGHLKQAMKMSALMIEATARHHALHGFDEVQVFQGKVCWKEDPKLAGLSDADLAQLGRTDRYERKPRRLSDPACRAAQAIRSARLENVVRAFSENLRRESGARTQRHHIRGAHRSRWQDAPERAAETET